jgi:uncharacterized protein
MSNQSLIWIYITSVLSLSLIVGGLVSYYSSKESRVWKAFPAFYTFFPAVVAFTVMWAFGLRVSLKSLGIIFSGNWIYYCWAILIPCIYLGLNALIQLKIGNYSVKSQLRWVEVIISALANQLVLVVFIAGEEIGWRSFLQDRLIREYGVWPAIFILGVVWGMWHAPVALKGFNLPAYPKFEAFVFFPFVCICYSAMMVFLTFKTHSIIPAILFHTTNNNLGGICLVVFDKKNPRSEVVIYFVIGIAMLIVSWFLLQGY